MKQNFSIIKETRDVPSCVSFSEIKTAILGADYRLNLIFTTTERIRKLNTTYRGQDKPTDILSFPLTASEGEIYISPIEAREESRKFDRTYENFVAFLFIHGCVHLKGHDHGSRMESIEVEMRQRFGI